MGVHDGSLQNFDDSVNGMAPTEAGPRERVLTALGIGFLAFGLRVFYLWSVWPNPVVRLPLFEGGANRERALEIVSGDWAGSSVHFLDPFYPFFLAILYAVFGEGSLGVFLAQAFVDSLSVVLVFFIGLRLFGYWPALVSGGIAASYKLFFYYDAFLIQAPLTLFLILLALHLSVRAAEKERVRAWIPAGGVLGLAVLSQGIVLFFVPVLLSWIVWLGQGSMERRLKGALLLLVSVGCVMGLGGAQNALMGKDSLLLNGRAGTAFFVGNFTANEPGMFSSPAFMRLGRLATEKPFVLEAERSAGRKLSPAEVSNFWFARGFEEIVKNPERFIRQLGFKLLGFVNDYEIPGITSYDYYQRHVSGMLARPFPSYGAVLPLGLLGMILAWRNRRALLLTAFFCSYGLGLLLFYTFSDMRLPVVPVVILFAGFAPFRLWQLARQRSYAVLVASAVFLGAGYAVAHQELGRRPLSVDYLNIGTGFLERSEKYWELGLEKRDRKSPRAAQVTINEAFRLRALAEEQFVLGLEVFPSHFRLRNALRVSMLAGIIQFEELGMHRRVLHGTLRLTKRFDAFPAGYLKLGSAYERQGEKQKALMAFRRAYRLDPENHAALDALTRLETDAETEVKPEGPGPS